MKPDKILLSLSLLIILTTFSWISSCTHKADLTGMYKPCMKEVWMIFSSSCVYFKSGTTVIHCHDGDGESDLRLDSFKSIFDAVETPGDPYSSPVYKAIIAKRGENKMPPSGPLSLDNRTIIRLWIEQGASTDITDCDTAVVVSYDPYLNQRSGVNRMAPAESSLPAKTDNLRSGSIPAL